MLGISRNIPLSRQIGIEKGRGGEKRRKKKGGGGEMILKTPLRGRCIEYPDSLPICYLVEAEGDNPLGGGGVGGDAFVHLHSCHRWHFHRWIVPDPSPGVLFWSSRVVVVRFYHIPVRCDGGKNAHTYPGLGAGPFDGHNASLGQERAIDDQEEPLKYYDNVKS